MGEESGIVERLGRLDVCAVSDAMDKLGLKGGVSGLDQRATTRRIAGRVVTMRLVAKEPAPPPANPPRHLGTTAIANANPGDIIVVEQSSGIEAGSWGGILSLGAQLKGVAGVICDGPVRDIDEAREVGFPVSARGRIAEAANNGPVVIGEVTVNAGDYAIADASGIVFIAAADIGRLLEAAEMIVAREAAMNAYLTGERVRANPHHRAAQPGRPDPFDEFADSGMKEMRDLRRLFCDNFYFGCEADDRMMSVAFNRRLSPVGAKLKAMFGSDIGHWDVMEARTVLSEAWSLFEGQLLSKDDFRELTFVNPASMHLGMNPHYFKGTAIEAQAAGLVAKGVRATA